MFKRQSAESLGISSLIFHVTVNSDLIVNVVLALEEALVVFSLSYFCLFHNMTEAHSPDGLFCWDRIGRTFLNQRKMEVKEWVTELAEIMTGEAKSFGQRVVHDGHKQRADY